MSPSNDILTINEDTQTSDSRFKIVREYQKEWTLLLDSVRGTDAGTYTCRIIISGQEQTKQIELVVKSESMLPQGSLLDSIYQITFIRTFIANIAGMVLHFSLEVYYSDSEAKRKPWRGSHGGGAMEEEPWRGSHGGGAMEAMEGHFELNF